MPRTITWLLEINWDKGDIPFIDETARLLSASGSVRLAPPESGISSPRGTVDRCSLVLNNSDGRFSPLNTSSPLWSLITKGNAYHAPMRLDVSIDGGSNFERVFTGVIKIPREGPPYPGVAATVEIDCRSMDEIVLAYRQSTTLATFRALHDDGATESEIIQQFLDDAGVDSANYTLDPGLFVVPWAWLDDESPLEDIWQLAAACGGRFYCDQEGEFRYENMTHWLMSPHDTSVETLAESGYGQMVGPVYDDNELFSAVTVVASPRETLETTTLWQADAVTVVPASATVTVVAKLRQPAYTIDEATFTAVHGGSRNMDSDISIVMTKFAQRVELAITNANTTFAANIITLELTGIPVSGAPSSEETRTSGDSFWVGFADVRPGRVKLLRGNAYVQTLGQAGALASFLKDRYQVPRLSFELKNVPGVPARRLGDRITVDNTNAMTSSREGFIISIDFRLSLKGFVQDLEVIDGADLYPFGNPGDDGYFVIGSNELGGESSGHDVAHIFY